MVDRVFTRVVSAAGVAVMAVVLALGLSPVSAQAAPPKLTSIEIAGKDVDGKITVVQANEPRMFSSLLTEVNWMATAASQTSAPKADKLGPKYTLAVLAGKNQQQVYELFPLATGGPRVHRPAKQPTGKKADGWFYGRLTMPETLRVSGVPLEAKPDVVHGGIGGGIGEDLKAEEADPVAAANELVDEVQRLFLLNGAVLVVILVGLAGIAFLIRRRV